MIEPVTEEQMASQFMLMKMRYGWAFPCEPQYTSAKDVIEDVSRRSGIPENEIMARGRGLRPASNARQECYFIMHRHMGYSLPVIGRIMSRDHTSILHGIKAVEARQ